MTSYATSIAQKNLIKGRTEERNLIQKAFAALKEGKTKDFNMVCDRLEKKYKK